MNKYQFGLNGESLVAEKLDDMGIKYWWNPSQRNHYGADFLTEYGVIDVKTAMPQIQKKLSKKSGQIDKKTFWRFNCHHHGKKQEMIDFFIFIVVGYKNKQSLYLVMPKEFCNSFSFNISERQIDTGKYGYFLDAWNLLKDGKEKKRIIQEMCEFNKSNHKHMKLNIEKITKELKRLNKTSYWLAKKIGTSRQLVRYWINTGSLAGVERIAKALGLNPRDLIK